MATLEPTGIINRTNPYPGPRTFRPDERDRFFGRDREARDLTALIVSQRLVLFYSQSGAGKSSLINTRIIPNLAEENGFEVLPVGRVKGYDGFEVTAGNIFVYNLLASLHQIGHAPAELAEMETEHFLNNLVCKGDRYGYDDQYDWTDADLKPRALIIDQFEEIFTTNNAFWRQRDEFFRQLGEALRADEHLWVVLAMREDFIASLDPYLHYLPDGLRHRFYMQQLRREDALKAIKLPVAELRPFEEASEGLIGAADLLVNNLLTIHGADATGQDREAEFVEPVQLQAVCYQMWEKLAARPGPTITCQDVADFADVDTALTSFYEDTIADTVRQTAVGEVTLRDWFEHELITESRTRNMVFRGEEVTGSVPTTVADVVRNHLLVREIVRPAGIWYELIHDRFVQPVLDANRAWRQNQPLLQLAERWAADRHNLTLLLPPDQLAYYQATDWQNFGSTVSEFMEASAGLAAEQAKAAEETRRAARYRRLSLIAAATSILVLLLATSTIVTYLSARQAIAEQQAAQTSEARAVSEAGRADAERVAADQARATAEAASAERDRQLAVNEALRLADKADDYLGGDEYAPALLLGALAGESAPTTRAQSVLFRAANARIATAEAAAADLRGVLPVPDATVADLSRAASLLPGPDAGTLAAVIDGGIVWWPVDQPENASPLVLDAPGPIDQAAFATGHDLVAVASGPSLQLWRRAGDSWQPAFAADKSTEVGDVTALAFSPDGRRLAAARWCGAPSQEACRSRVDFWSVDAGSSAVSFERSIPAAGLVNGMAFLDEAGERLVRAGTDGVVLEEPAAGNSRPLRGLVPGSTRPRHVAVAPGEGWLVVVSCEVGSAGVQPSADGEAGQPAAGTEASPQQADGKPGTPDEEACTGSYTTRWWDLSESEPIELGLLPVGDDAASAVDVAYVPGLDAIVGLRADGSLTWWDARMAGWEARACDLAGRNLTAAEWRETYPESGLLKYKTTCPGYPAHVSLLEELVRQCREEDLAQAQRLWTEDPRQEGRATAVSFEEWAGGVLIDYLERGGTDDAEPCLAQLRGLDLPAGESVLTTADGVRRVVAAEANTPRRWEFNGRARDTVVVAGVPLSLDREEVALRLLDAEGNLLASFGPGPTAQLVFTLTQDGAYAIEAETPGGGAPVAVSAQVVPPRLIDLGDTVANVDLGVNGWRFDGERGQYVVLSVTTDPTLDATLRLIDDAGNELELNDDFDGRNPRIEQLLPEDGPYFLEVGWLSPPGPYTLATTVDPPAPIALGDTVQHAPAGSRDVWQFDGQANDSVTLDVTSSTQQGDAVLRLLDGQGDELTRNDDRADGARDPQIAAFLPGDGKYFALVEWIGPSEPYTLTTSVQTPAPLPLGASVPSDAERTLWRFDGAANQVATISLTPSSPSADASLTLRNSQNTIMATSDNYDGLNPRLNVLLPDTQTYLLEVLWNGAPSDYTLTASLSAPEALAYGQVARAGAGDVPVWQFDGQAGDLVAVDVSGDNLPAGAIVRLVSADRQELASGAISPGISPDLEALLAADAPYYLEIVWPQAPAPYAVSLDVATPDSLAAGDVREASSRQRFWTLTGEPGEFVSVSVTGPEGEDAFLRLLDDRGRELAFSSEPRGVPDHLGTLLTGDTPRYLSVNWYETPQPYTIAVDRLEPQLLVPGEPATGSGASLWQFEGRRGDYAVVEATLPDGLYFALRLLDGQGAELGTAVNASGAAAGVGVLLPADGTYYIEAFTPGAADSYTLAVQSAPARVLTPGVPVEASPEQRAWRFRGQAGARVTLSAETLVADGDLTLRLLDRQGNQLDYDDDRATGTRDPEIVFDLPANGEYFIEVGWYPGTSPAPYRLLLTTE